MLRDEVNWSRVRESVRPIDATNLIAACARITWARGLKRFTYRNYSAPSYSFPFWGKAGMGASGGRTPTVCIAQSGLSTVRLETKSVRAEVSKPGNALRYLRANGLKRTVLGQGWKRSTAVWRPPDLEPERPPSHPSPKGGKGQCGCLIKDHPAS